MPQMTGFELYRKMKEIDRSVRVCFMTNYAKEYLQEFTNSFPELTEENFTSKPADTSELLEIVESRFRESASK